MVKKSEYWQREAQRLTLILADIFEVLPQAGEERVVTWEKIGYIRALVYKGLIDDAWLDMSDDECKAEILEIMPNIRKENALFLAPKLLGGEA